MGFAGRPTGLAGPQDMGKVFLGIAVIIGFSLGGFLLMIWNITSDNSSVFTILFYMMVFPLIGCGIGLPLIIKGQGGMGTTTGFMSTESRREKSFIYMPPENCTSCGAKLSYDSIEWAGPLTAKCPYCGQSLPVQKREV
ncbi:MAG: hypothetical protein GF411_19155 [Candidatus Lokiarchaeota archaeon]|nr:hypothetical protein [Candidatus Lokiarchaeota archaeon]